jgi:hypothetical protein
LVRRSSGSSAARSALCTPGSMGGSERGGSERHAQERHRPRTPTHAPLASMPRYLPPPRLGGPEWHKNATVGLFVFLWFVYIALSASAA